MNFMKNFLTLLFARCLNMRIMSQITLKDVAQEAGVAVSTASLVLNNKGQFSQDVRDRVLVAAQKIGYNKPSPSAEGSRKRLDRVAILACEDPEKEPAWNFFRCVLIPLEATLTRERLYPVIIPVSFQQEPKTIIEKLTASKVKAVFSLEYGNQEFFQQLDDLGIPAVVINNNNFQNQVNSVCIDNFQGAYDGVKYLLSLGHTQLIYIDYSRREPQTPLNDRFIGFKMALEEQRVTVTEDARLTVDVLNVNELQRKLKHIFQRTSPPTAIFAYDDYLAARLIAALHNIQLRVPDDISLIAIGDLLDYQQPFIPRITTMQINNELMGKLAGEMLLEQLKTPQTGIHVLKVNQQLVERGSCLPIPYKKRFAVAERGTKESIAPKEIHLGVTCFSLQLTYWAMWAQAVAERAREADVQLTLIPCATAAEQAAAIRRFTGQGLDAIIIGPIDGTHADVALSAKEAMSAGISVIVSSVELEGVQVNCTVRCDNFKGGELAAEYLLKHLGGQGKIAILEGSWPQYRIQGFRKQLSTAPDCTIVFDAKCDWSRESAKQAIQEALALHPDLIGVYTACDPMALGALDAISAAQRTGITVVGFDGLPEACVAIYNGLLAATINQSPFVVGAKVVEMALRVLRGETVLPSVLVEPILITDQNVVETALSMLGLMPHILHNMIEISAEQQALHAEHLHIQTESQISRCLQQMFLATAGELQQITGLDLAGFTVSPFKSGTNEEALLREENGIHTGIGDITEHSLESGLLMLTFPTEIHTLIDHGQTTPESFLTTLEHVIARNTPTLRVVSPLTIAVINYRQGQIKMIGQPSAWLIVRQDGQIEPIRPFTLQFPYTIENQLAEILGQATISLQPGEGLVCYKASLIDAENAQDIPYGSERLHTIISRSWKASAEAIKHAIMTDVTRHIGAPGIYDDFALLVLKHI